MPRIGYDWLYRRGLTPWEAAAATQQDEIARLLDREEEDRPGRRVTLDLGCAIVEDAPFAVFRLVRTR